MRRFTLGMFVILLLAVPSSAAPDPKKLPDHDDAPRIAEKLLERIDISERIDKASLREVLELLSAKLNITILIDRRALTGGDGGEVEQRPITVPTMKRVRAETVLRYVADQIEAELYIAPDHLSLTTSNAKHVLTGRAKALPELYPEPAQQDNPDVDLATVVATTPYVTVDFKDVALADALKDVSVRAGRNVVISQPAAEKAKSLVSVRLSNVAFENAAATLSEAAGLRAFRSGNVVVIVTPERAKEVDKEAKSFGVAPWGNGQLPIGAGGISVEQLEAISKLLNHKPSDDDGKKKELEEKVKKLTEELEKLKKK